MPRMGITLVAPRLVERGIMAGEYIFTMQDLIKRYGRNEVLNGKIGRASCRERV